MSTNAEANELGFATPAGTELIKFGDDAIAQNARRATDLYHSSTNTANARHAALSALTAGYLDHGTVTTNTTLNITAAATHVLDAGTAIAITLADAPNGTVGTIIVPDGAHAITWTALVWPEAEPGLDTHITITVQRIRDQWWAWSAGATINDDTPPPAMGTVVLIETRDTTATVAFQAVTDPDSPVVYEYRTTIAAGSPTAWRLMATTGTTTLSGTLTGLTPDTEHLVEVRARSAGGPGTPASLTFRTDVTRGWVTLAADTFTGSGTLTGRTAPTGGQTWTLLPTTANSPTLTGGMAVWDTHAIAAQLYLPLTTGTRRRITAVYDLTQHTTTGSVSAISVGFSTNATYNNNLMVRMSSAGAISLLDVAAGTWTMTGTLTGHPPAGTIAFELDAAARTGIVTINGTQVATVAGDVALSLYAANVRWEGSTSKADSINAEAWQ